MEIEEFNELMELQSYYNDYFNRAVSEIEKSGKPITLNSVVKLFEKYQKELSDNNYSNGLDEKLQPIPIYPYEKECQPSNR